MFTALDGIVKNIDNQEVLEELIKDIHRDHMTRTQRLTREQFEACYQKLLPSLRYILWFINCFKWRSTRVSRKSSHHSSSMQVQIAGCETYVASVPYKRYHL